MKIALVGTGKMGRALGSRLLDGGHELTLWNRTSGKAGELVGRGATEAGTAPEAVRGAEVVFSVLANDDAVLETTTGEHGFLASLDPSSLYVDSSTVSPATSTELARRFPNFVAMPILGNPDAVKAGTATFLPAGTQESLHQLRPLLSDLGTQFHTYDDVALAAAAKLTSNLLLLVGLAGLAEAASVGLAGGLSRDQLHELLDESPMLAPGLHNRFDAVLTGDTESWWTIRLGAKDLRLALAVGEGSRHPLELAEAARQVYQDAIDSGSGDDDIAAIGSLYRNAE